MMQHMLARYVPGEHRWQTLGFAIDHGWMARATLARIHWLQGRPEEALRMGRETLAAVRSQGHAISICYVLSEATLPLALLAEDAAAAAEAQRLLQDIATQNGLAIWLEAARFTRLVLRIAAGEAVAAPVLQEALTALRRTGYTVHAAALCGIAADALAGQGELAAATALVEDALATCAANQEGWAVAELLRVQGRLAFGATAGPGPAIDCLRRAIDLGRQQHALTWELRAATTLAQLGGASEAAQAARALLGGLLARFAPGVDTADTIRARAVLRPR